MAENITKGMSLWCAGDLSGNEMDSTREMQRRAVGHDVGNVSVSDSLKNVEY